MPISPLRILATIHSFDPGGVERVALRLCESWQAEGADVVIVVGRMTGAMREQAPGLAYVNYPPGLFPVVRFETLWMILCLWRRIKVARPDVIFCPGNTYAVVAVALRLLLGRNCPPVVAKISNSLVRSDMDPIFGWAYRAWLAMQGRLIDAFVAMAPSLREEAAQAMRVERHEVAVVDDPALSAADHERLSNARQNIGCEQHAGRLFVSVGRLAAQKRFDRLIRAFAQGARADDRLVILGEGPHRGRLQRLIRRLCQQERVAMPGHTSELGDWLGRADVFVLASDYEGVPAALVEALAAGLPVISTRSSAAIPELLDHGRLGKVIAPNDERALAQALNRIDPASFDPEEARRIATRFQIERAGPAYLRHLTAAFARHSLRDGPTLAADPPTALTFSLGTIDVRSS